MKMLAAVAALLMGLQVSAQTSSDCRKPSARDITIPDGQVASREEMLSTRKAVNDYVEQMNVFLECLDQRSSTLPEGEDGARARDINDARYNAARDEMLRLAERFNVQVRAYQVRQERPD
jgi:hypothetical protein